MGSGATGPSQASSALGTEAAMWTRMKLNIWLTKLQASLIVPFQGNLCHTVGTDGDPEPTTMPGLLLAGPQPKEGGLQ